MLKLNTNKPWNSFIVLTGAFVMLIIFYMGVNEMKGYSNFKYLSPITNRININESTMKDKADVDIDIKEYLIFGEKASDVIPFNDNAAVLIK